MIENKPFFLLCNKSLLLLKPIKYGETHTKKQSHAKPVALKESKDLKAFFFRCCCCRTHESIIIKVRVSFDEITICIPTRNSQDSFIDVELKKKEFFWGDNSRKTYLNYFEDRITLNNSRRIKKYKRIPVNPKEL